MSELEMSEDSQEDYNRCQQILRRHESDLLALPEVIGVGVGQSDSGELGLVLLLKDQPVDQEAASQQDLPTELEGVPVWHRHIGSISAQQDRPPAEEV